jgi:hypothetical protein
MSFTSGHLRRPTGSRAFVGSCVESADLVEFEIVPVLTSDAARVRWLHSPSPTSAEAERLDVEWGLSAKKSA